MSIETTDWAEDLESAEQNVVDEAPQPIFTTLPAFVVWLTQAYRRELTCWCPYWWKHSEAVFRLHSLWHAFENLAAQPGTGRAVWLRDYCDPTMNMLTNPDTSTFRGCRNDKGHWIHREYPPFPLATPPADLFPEETSQSVGH